MLALGAVGSSSERGDCCTPALREPQIPAGSSGQQPCPAALLTCSSSGATTAGDRSKHKGEIPAQKGKAVPAQPGGAGGRRAVLSGIFSLIPMAASSHGHCPPWGSSRICSSQEEKLHPFLQLTPGVLRHRSSDTLLWQSMTLPFPALSPTESFQQLQGEL